MKKKFDKYLLIGLFLSKILTVRVDLSVHPVYLPNTAYLVGNISKTVSEI